MTEVSPEIKEKLIASFFEGKKDFLTGQPVLKPYSIKESKNFYTFYFEHIYKLGNINDGKKYYTSASISKEDRNLL